MFYYALVIVVIVAMVIIVTLQCIVVSREKEVTLGMVGAASNINGATISTDQQLRLQPANTTYGGIVSTTSQSFAGLKTFTNGIQFANPSTVLNTYEEYSDTPTYEDNGFTVIVTNGSFTYSITKLGRLVTFSMNRVVFSDNPNDADRTNTVIAANAIPARFIPAETATFVAFPVLTNISGSTVTWTVGQCSIDRTGGITFHYNQLNISPPWGAELNNVHGVSV